MEGRESSVASSTDFYESDGKPATPVRDPQHDASPAKRKAEDGVPVPEKKRKLQSPSPPVSSELTPCAGLAPAIWQHVFLFCSLADLGRLLQVNRSFHCYLTDVRNVSSPKPESGCLRLLKSDSIWASARNALEIKPPKPLPGFTESQMWQLTWSKSCQFCGKQNSFTPGEKIWQQGPGASGVRTIWPFAIQSCGPCLVEQCQTDASLLFSNTSALRPALPFAFITNDQHYIPAYTLQAATTPAGVEIVKYYYKPHVEHITKELENAMSLGPAAAGEWSKGLDGRGKERMKAAENWERWEVRYQWWSDHQEPKPAVSSAPSPAPTSQKQPANSPPPHPMSPIIHAPVPASKYRSVQFAAREDSLVPRFNNTPVPNLTDAANTAPHYVQPRPPTVPAPVFTPQPVPGSTQSWRGERNLHDANEAKANRKADIERRCQQLDPPIPPNVLRHMESFKAAIQIPHPMNDHSWNMLLPRLLSQLPAAQQQEADHVSRGASLPTRAADRRLQDMNTKEAKEVQDREWEESQRPIRDKLSAFADDFINQDWDHGRAVTYENSPKFAADLLMYVRRMFYADVANEEGVSPEAQQQPGSADSPESQRPKLVLENMKWVYDNKLKPLTEQFRKELFLCNGCEGNTRFYGFEGVIQHYGAKHTNAFSVGNVVVAWREAEWPEETPFHADPISVKHTYHAPSTMAGHSGYGSYYGGYSRAGTSTPHVQAHLPQASPGPYHYGGHYNGPFAPPHAPPNTIPGYDYSQPYGAGMDSYSFQPMAPPGYAPQTSNTGYMTSPALTNSAIAPPPTGPQEQSVSDSTPQSGDAEHRTSAFDKQVSTIIDMAQDIWKQTSGIKDLPNSLRIYVLLQRVISKFHIEFNHEPNLNHFFDALSNHQIPKALKNAPGLSCKACQDESSRLSSTGYSSQWEERRTYTVLNLFSHFKAQHTGPHIQGYVNGPLPPQLDWKEDMIELPSDRLISGLIHAPGMDDDKLHMIATVFPKLFPTPLPKIGVVDNNGVASPTHSTSKDSNKDGPRAGGTPGVPMEQSRPSSLASPYADSPRPSKPNDDEYDPQRPALSAQSNQSARPSNRKHSYHGSPPSTDRRPRYYAEPRYDLPRDALDDDYPGPREYVEYAPSPRRMRDPGPVYEDYHGRRSVYRDRESFYGPSSYDVVYAHPREGMHAQEYGPYPSRPIRYYEEDNRRPEYRWVREPRSREASPPGDKSEVDRFLEELVPGQPSTTESTQDVPPRTEPKPPAPEADPEDGSRYTPPPPNVPSGDESLAPHRSLAAAPHTAPSTVSNGSRYEEYRTGSRQVPTPDSAGPPRRVGPHRRRDRHHDSHVPSRYYRIAREEPYGRGASMARSQSRRYERYEEQRRRIDQQETPQPNADHDPSYSRDQSVDHGPPDDPYYAQIRHAPREYISVQDRLRPYSPPRYRYAGPSEDARGPVYIDEYGRPVDEYEIIRVRDHRQPRGPYMSHAPPTRYFEPEPEHFQYVPLAYERPPAQRYDDRPGQYVFFEERERPLPQRRPAFEPQGSEPYEPPPPEIKVESAAPVPVPEGP